LNGLHIGAARLNPRSFAKAAWVIDDLLLLFVGMRPIVELMHLM
jgi:hypothetical protein